MNAWAYPHPPPPRRGGSDFDEHTEDLITKPVEKPTPGSQVNHQVAHMQDRPKKPEAVGIELTLGPQTRE